MSEAKHTPGPWQVVPAEETEFNGYMDVSRISGFDIHAPSRIVIGCEGIGPDAEGLANANLVAAAPELLEALEIARNGLQWYRDTYPEAGSGADDEAMEQIDAAIAKATGSAS